MNQSEVKAALKVILDERGLDTIKLLGPQEVFHMEQREMQNMVKKIKVVKYCDQFVHYKWAADIISLLLDCHPDDSRVEAIRFLTKNKIAGV